MQSNACNVYECMLMRSIFIVTSDNVHQKRRDGWQSPAQGRTGHLMPTLLRHETSATFGRPFSPSPHTHQPHQLALLHHHSLSTPSHPIPPHSNNSMQSTISHLFIASLFNIIRTTNQNTNRFYPQHIYMHSTTDSLIV